MIVAAVTIASVLAFFHNLESSFQNKVQQITNQLETQKADQQHQFQLKLQKLQQDNSSKDQQIQQKDKQIQDLQQQVSLKKQQEAARVAASQAAQQAANVYVASSGNCEAYRSLVSQYAWNVNVAMAIMHAESGCNPTATSPTCDHGLMQINCVHAAAVGGNLALLNDPATNIRVAYAIYTGSGWNAWTTYTSGAYRRYL